MSDLPLAFLMGLFGSLHCAVMCGPIMLSFPIQTKANFAAILQLFLYQFGRITIYTFMGLIVGGLGSTLKLFTEQRWLSAGIGLVLVMFALMQFNRHYRNQISVAQSNFFRPLGKLMGKFYNKFYWGFAAGLLNGLVPCGMVYLALSTALNLADMQSSIMFMFLFGLGTAPLMLMISLGGIYLKRYIHFNTQKLVPWLMILIGIVFIMRSAELGIPFISPHTQQHYGTAVNCQ